MPDTATLEAWLAQAETALHKLLTGTLAVQVDYQGTRTTFAAGDEAKLRAYIAELKVKLGKPDARPRRAVGVVFR